MNGFIDQFNQFRQNFANFAQPIQVSSANILFTRPDLTVSR